MCDLPDPFALFFRLRTPCSKCPFRKQGAIELRPGRLEGIIEDLLTDDHASFPCHNTLTADDSFDEEDPARTPRVMEGEKMCAGAAAYLMKEGRPSVGMRYAIALGIIPKDQWSKAEGVVIDPKPKDRPTTERWQTLQELKAP
jgi:hypothetical protein